MHFLYVRRQIKLFRTINWLIAKHTIVNQFGDTVRFNTFLWISIKMQDFFADCLFVSISSSGTQAIHLSLLCWLNEKHKILKSNEFSKPNYFFTNRLHFMFCLFWQHLVSKHRRSYFASRLLFFFSLFLSISHSLLLLSSKCAMIWETVVRFKSPHKLSLTLATEYRSRVASRVFERFIWRWISQRLTLHWHLIGILYALRTQIQHCGENIEDIS